MLGEFRCETTDGVEIVGRLQGNPASSTLVVFTHGFSSSQDNSTSKTLVPQVGERGLGAMTFDFRGCGDSGGQLADTTISSGLKDLAAALVGAFARRDRPESVVFVGSSFGAAVALASVTDSTDEPAPARLRVAGMVLKAPMLRLAEAQRLKRGDAEMARWRDQGWIDVGTDGDEPLKYEYITDSLKYDFFSRDFTKNFAAPVYIVQGTEDDTAPYEFAEAFTLLAPRRQLQPVWGAGHQFDGAGEREALVKGLVKGLKYVL